ncbi:hypothetical protein A2U01_0060797, partial [Trifolium medium]|nr:hypothetical protein [Trifolium medium]
QPLNEARKQWPSSLHHANQYPNNSELVLKCQIAVKIRPYKHARDRKAKKTARPKFSVQEAKLFQATKKGF